MSGGQGPFRSFRSQPTFLDMQVVRHHKDRAISTQYEVGQLESNRTTKEENIYIRRLSPDCQSMQQDVHNHMDCVYLYSFKRRWSNGQQADCALQVVGQRSALRFGSNREENGP